MTSAYRAADGSRQSGEADSAAKEGAALLSLAALRVSLAHGATARILAVEARARACTHSHCHTSRHVTTTSRHVTTTSKRVTIRHNMSQPRQNASQPRQNASQPRQNASQYVTTTSKRVTIRQSTSKHVWGCLHCTVTSGATARILAVVARARACTVIIARQNTSQYVTTRQTRHNTPKHVTI